MLADAVGSGNDPRTLIPFSLTACICVHGSPAYLEVGHAAAGSVLEHTDWDLVIVSDAPVPIRLASDPRVTVVPLPRVASGDRATRFLVKLRALAIALDHSDTDLLALLDADTRIVRRTSAQDAADALGEYDLALVEQTGIRGSDMDRARFLEHYRDVSLAFIDPDAALPDLAAFRFVNSGVVLGRRAALRGLTASVLDRVAQYAEPHAVGAHMVADQDYIQHWVNTLHPGSCAELGWEWNHCAWWDEPFPRDGARILHFSNFCLGPAPETLAQMDAAAARLAQSERPGVTAVVVAYRSAACIADCVRALCLAGAAAIIVVDNASDDQSASIAEGLGCDVVRLPRNHGFAVAANAGARLCTTPVVVFVNPDCVVDTATLRRGAELCDNAEPVCAVPDFRDGAGEITRGVQPGYTRRGLLADIAMLRTGGAGRTAAREDAAWSWPLGACLFMPVAVFRRLGGFDEGYFLYMEDVDLGQRLAAAGGAIHSTETIVEHAQQQGSDVDGAERVRLLADARVRYAQAAFGPLTAWRARRRAEAIA